MTSLKSKILIIVFLFLSIFPVYKLINVETEIEIRDYANINTEIIDSGTSDANIPEPETTLQEAKEESSDPVQVEKAIEEVKAEVPKNSTLSNIVTIAEHVIKKAYQDKDELTLGIIAGKILASGTQKSELEKKLDAFSLKKPVVKKLTESKGFRIKSIVVINKHPLNAIIEVGKKGKDWYAVFYIKSPAKWKVSEYFPELLDINKILPGLDKSILGKYTKSDLFEFADSYFYISTVEIDDYKKFGKIVKGAGFSGKVKFSGAFEALDKMFAIDGKYLDISGQIPAKLVDSEFLIKLPKATIIPEVLKVPGKPDINLIKGFSVDLADQIFKIKFTKGLPEINSSGLITVKLPCEDKPIDFRSKLGFADKKLKISGRQKTKMDSLFGVKGFAAQDCRINISWDFGTKNILPKMVRIRGKLQSGKSKLDLTNFEVSTSEDKKINLSVLAKGSLYTKDFAELWLDVVLKDQIKNKTINKVDVLKLIPEVTLDDISLNINWTDKIEDRAFKLKVNKADVKLGVAVGGLISGISGAAGNVSKNNDIVDYLNKFSLKKAVMDYYKGGIRIRSNVTVNNKPVRTTLEVAKNTDNKWYSLFYLESPEKWKASELFPSSDKATLDKISKLDMLEFKKSFFYISTIDIPEYQKSVMPKAAKSSSGSQERTLADTDGVEVSQESKEEEIDLKKEELEEKAAEVEIVKEQVESEKPVATEGGAEIEETTEAAEKTAKDKITIKIVKGVGFSGKARFSGELEMLDKLFDTKGKFFDVSGNITSKLLDSEFSIKLPKATIIPEVLKVPGKPDVNLIKGFKVDLADQIFKIKFTKGLPEINSSGLITVKLPYEDKPIDFRSKLDFADKKLKISGRQKTKMDSLFGVKGLSAQDCRINISWDFGTKNILPKTVRIRGKLQSGKSKLDLTNFEVSTSEDKKINLKVLAKGSLYTKDFAQFWSDAIIKDKKITDFAMPLVPDIALDDVTLNVNWTDKVEERAFNLKVNKADIKLGTALKGLIPSAVEGLEKELNAFSIKKAVIDSYKGGLRIRTNVSIKGKPLKASLEIAKEDDTKKDSKYYSLFYFESPEKWRLSELLPDFLTAKKLFPKMDKALLDKLATPDLFEFEKSFFYISTIDIPEYKKSVMSKATSGAAASSTSSTGSERTLADTDGVEVGQEDTEKTGQEIKEEEIKKEEITQEETKKEELEEKAAEVEIVKQEAESEKPVATEDGAVIENTTEAAEKTAKDKITIHIVKGVGFSGNAKFIGAFDVFDKLLGLEGKSLEVSGNITSKLTDSDFSIKIPTAKTIIPETIKISGQDVKLIPGFKVDLIQQDFKIKFVKGFPEFSGSGGIKVTVPYEKEPLEFSSNIIFENKNLKISGDQKTAISKLFGVEGLIVDGCHADISWDASSINPIPKVVNINGKVHSGKSNLDLKLDFSLDEKKKVNFGVTSTGDLFVKDFAQFWLNVIIKDPKITSAVMPLMPDFKLEGVVLNANWADKEEDRKLKLEVKKADIKLGQIVKILIPQANGQESDIEKYLNKFSITKASAEYYKKGIRVTGSTLVNNNPLDLFVEACKDDKKGWYALFYLKSPEKWKVSDYLPDFLNAKTLFPKLDPQILAQLEKPDILEFSESYFYISTISMKDHEKVGNLVQGAGFKGKAKFIGILDVLDKIFVLNGQPLEISGDLKVPKFFGSRFAIKIPTNAVIIPQSITLKDGKKLDLIKDFQVSLTPYELEIKLIDDIPYAQLNTTGGILVKIPGIKENLDLFGKLKFSGKQMSLSGGQRTKLTNVLDIKGLDLDGCEIGLNWDFGVSGKLAAQLAPATFGIGSLAVLLPTGFILEGGLSSQKPASSKKNSLNIKTDFSLNSTNSVDLKYESRGTLFAKDFAEFWLDFIVRTPNKQNDKKFKQDFIKQIPDWTFEDVYIKGAWAKDADKELILNVGKVEMIPGVQAKMDLKVSEAGISGSGAILSAILLPDKNNTVFQLSKSLINKTEGPSFAVDCTINPLKIALKGDAGLVLKSLFPGFKPIESETKIDVSEDGVDLESKTKLLDFDSNLKIKGKLGTPIKIDDWEIVGGFEQKTTEEMSKILKATSQELLKANSDITKQKSVVQNNINASRDKALKDIEDAKNKANNDLDKFFKDSKNITTYTKGVIQKDLSAWKKHHDSIGRQGWDVFGWAQSAEKTACWIFQIAPREVALLAVNIFSVVGDLAKPIISAFAKTGNQVISDIGKAFVSVGTGVGNAYAQLGLDTAALFTKAAGDIAKIIDDISSQVFTIHSLKVEAKVADIKNGKLPLIEYDATVMGKRTLDSAGKPTTRKVQLDIKNPGDFIKAVAEIVTKDVAAIISGKINEADKAANAKLEEQKNKAAAEIKAATEKAAAAKKI